MTSLFFDTPHRLEKQLAQDLAHTLQNKINLQGRVCLAVSGGRSPIGLFEHLCNEDLDWSAVTLTLVDERWVPEDHEASNARLVQTHLRCKKASIAPFFPLWRKEFDEYTGIDFLNQHWNNQIPLVAVLGMGTDGHIASLFPQTPLTVRHTKTPFVVTQAPVDPAVRVSMTLPLLQQADGLFLQWSGMAKQQIYEQAERHDTTAQDLPVKHILNLPQFHLYACQNS